MTASLRAKFSLSSDDSMRRSIFADEAGCLTFKRKKNISKYFILATLTVDDWTLGDDLMQLRRELAWEGLCSERELHATEDHYDVRDRVFALLGRHEFRVDCTILEKSKAEPKLRKTDATFYQYAWFYHLKFVAPRVSSTGDEIQVFAASIGTKKKRRAFKDALDAVARQTLPHTTWGTVFWPARSDPCLQAVDYCAWALQRKWEYGDSSAYRRIAGKVQSEYDLFSAGTTHYY